MATENPTPQAQPKAQAKDKSKPQIPAPAPGKAQQPVTATPPQATENPTPQAQPKAQAPAPVAPPAPSAPPVTPVVPPAPPQARKVRILKSFDVRFAGQHFRLRAGGVVAHEQFAQFLAESQHPVEVIKDGDA